MMRPGLTASSSSYFKEKETLWCVLSFVLRRHELFSSVMDAECLESGITQISFIDESIVEVLVRFKISARVERRDDGDRIKRYHRRSFCRIAFL